MSEVCYIVYMVREAIKSASGATLGYRAEQGARTLVQDLAGQTLGWFDKNTKKTFDKSGKPLYIGDMTVALLTS